MLVFLCGGSFLQVDAHNVVPCWEASPKLEYGARTIRSKINGQLSTYLTAYPPVCVHPHKSKETAKVGEIKSNWCEGQVLSFEKIFPCSTKLSMKFKHLINACIGIAKIECYFR